jgi:hypothetical protein
VAIDILRGFAHHVAVDRDGVVGELADESFLAQVGLAAPADVIALGA